MAVNGAFLYYSYPGVLQGNKVYNSPVSSLRYFCNDCVCSKHFISRNRVYDGVNLLPYLTGEKDCLPHKVFYWRNGYSQAIRNGDWKLYINKKNKATYLFNLANDISELHDLSKQYPGKINELKQQLEQWENTQFMQPRWKSGADVQIDVNGEVMWFPT
jgi:hypothetical protein